jgi:hypothetical protein
MPEMESTIGEQADSDSDIGDLSTDFESPLEMMEYVTLNWRRNFVTLALSITDEELAVFSKRPFFLLVKVDAPIMTRWRRSQLRYV